MTPSVTLATLTTFLGSGSSGAGDHGQRRVLSGASLDTADEHDLAFCSAGGEEGVALVNASRAGVVLVRPEVADARGASDARALIATPRPRLDFVRVMREFFPVTPPRGVHRLAEIGTECRLGRDVYVGPFAYVDALAIGDRTVIHGHAHVYAGVRIGSDVTIHAGAVIGADGFGYERDDDGRLLRLDHRGDVVVEDDVEIGANACVDRGTFGSTVIGRGTKIDDGVYIAHNVRLGEHCAVIGGARICGSTAIGARTWIAPGATVRDKVTIGPDAMVGLGATVVTDVPAGTTVIGTPARAAVLRNDEGQG